MNLWLASPIPSDPAALPLRFSGAAGHWLISARRVNAHQLDAVMGADDLALSRVLALLSGGIFDVGPPDQVLASLAVSATDTEGQLWFDCARDKMF